MNPPLYLVRLLGWAVFICACLGGTALAEPSPRAEPTAVDAKPPNNSLKDAASTKPAGNDSAEAKAADTKNSGVKDIPEFVIDPPTLELHSDNGGLVLASSASGSFDLSVRGPAARGVAIYAKRFSGPEGGSLAEEAIALNPEKPIDLNPSQKAQRITIRINLKDVACGKWSGALALRYQGREQSIPVSILVRHTPGLPILVLFVGMVLSVLLASYRLRGAPRDALLSRIGRLEAQLDDIPQLFLSRIKLQLRTAHASLQRQSQQEAEELVGRAEATLLRYRQDANNWQQQIDGFKEQQRTLLDDLSSHASELREKFQELESRIPDLELPAKLREALKPLREQTNTYKTLLRLLRRVEELRLDLTDNKDFAEWNITITNLQERLYRSKPEAAQVLQTLENDLDNSIKKLQELGCGMRSRGAQGREASSTESPAQSILPSIVPGAELAGATLRQQAVKVVLYLGAILTLTYLGFKELYLSQSTFGANWMGDYFGLLVWCFGAEATSGSVLERVFGGLPELRSLTKVQTKGSS